MIFSNNMEYEDGASEPLQGAFYASTSYGKPIFNYFREEHKLDLQKVLLPTDFETETSVLKDNNLEAIRTSPEFGTNKSAGTPTNRICTSLLSKERLAFMLRYSIAYVSDREGIQKHVMRYPQLFATKAIESKLEDGVNKGIIWHTQGSGKTALAYYNVRHLTDYFQRKGVIPKFYFIVDRIDLLTQAQSEFLSRGLIVHTMDSRDDFAKDIRSNKAIHNDSGLPEITVVNIQKFKDDPNVVQARDYDLSIQRIYFLDEVHRSYNPKGSFLANLDESDRNAIKIGLTGTPLLGTDNNSRMIFGDYIHKYYYNSSIADGYTLRLIREEIESNYKRVLQQALWDIDVQQGSIEKKDVLAHPLFVAPMLEYIVNNFEDGRGIHNDGTIGALVICDSADQAKEMYKQFVSDYEIKNSSESLSQYNQKSSVSESYKSKLKYQQKVKTAALILYDVGTKDDRKDWTDDFKAGKIDILFVYNMLQTGFDAARLKKLYLGRVVRKHNLLQSLTRVNRPFKAFRYGYVVDFADITSEFEATNKAYFEELQLELGDEFETYSNLFKSSEEINEEINSIKEILFEFDIENAEVFSQQLNGIESRENVLEIKKALSDARVLYNLIRMQGEYNLLDGTDFDKLNVLLRETNNHLNLLNLSESVASGNDMSNLLNTALENVIFQFAKIGEEELVLADQLKNTLQRTQEALQDNFDKKDPKFFSLKEELARLLKKKNLSDTTQTELNKNIAIWDDLLKRSKQLNNSNERLSHKYSGDKKYARIHKRLMENKTIMASDGKVYIVLNEIKKNVDEQVFQNGQVLLNHAYFEKMLMQHVIAGFSKSEEVNINVNDTKSINTMIMDEYQNEYKTGTSNW